MSGPPPVVIVGTGHSGTRFISAALTAIGVDVGHEAWWGIFGPWTREQGPRPGMRADASWLAVPELGDYRGAVLAQWRDPLRVYGSLTSGQLTSNSRNPYLAYKYRHTPGTVGTWDGPDALRFIAHWWSVIAEHAAAEWRLEAVDGPTLQAIARAHFGHDAPLTECEAAVAEHRGTNKHWGYKVPTWTDLPDTPDRPLVRSLAEAAGYTYE